VSPQSILLKRKTSLTPTLVVTLFKQISINVLPVQTTRDHAVIDDVIDTKATVGLHLSFQVDSVPYES
jgi:hypothetical protein